VNIQRFGKALSSAQVNYDEYLIGMIGSIQGGNMIMYHVVSSPKFIDKWASSKQSAEYCLFGNETWTTGFDAYLDEISNSDSNTTVSISIYNPCNTIISLYKLSKNELSYLPILEAVVEESIKPRIRVLLGELVWDEKTFPSGPELIIDAVFGNMNLFLAAMHFGETYRYEMDVISLHGLT
jgi:hypothetical protein